MATAVAQFDEKSLRWGVLILSTLLTLALPVVASPANRKLHVGSSGMPNPDRLLFGERADIALARRLWPALEHGTARGSDYLVMGQLLVLEGYPAFAVNVVHHGVGRFPEDPELRVFLALALETRSQRDRPEALDTLQEAAKLFPSNAPTQLAFANALAKDGRPSEAIDSFNRAIALSQDPTIQLAAHLGLAGCLTMQGDEKQASMHLRIAKAIYPKINLILDDAAARSRSPPAIYGEEDDGSHPSPDERMRRALREIQALSPSPK